jgi:energy-coupling factor transporter ATP-binding protein EcfA2
MPVVDAIVECPVYTSFRVDQVRGMFDLQLEKAARSKFHVEVPGADEDWQIGAIVGPSGSGKSTVARKVFGKALYKSRGWPSGRAMLDGFPAGLSIKSIVQSLTSVGISSPPSWVKPYAVLSNGERFRCDLARAMLTDRPVVAFDEFTSVVDRTVAQMGSAALSKAIRKGQFTRRFVAITCHYDILDWLEPDWVLDMTPTSEASGVLARGRLWRRPPIKFEIAPVHRHAWTIFRRHHYLNTAISKSSQCFCAFLRGQPVAFSAWLSGMPSSRGRAPDMREHRTVVLPDYQGLGIGNRLSEFCASIWTGLGKGAASVTSHPGMIHYRSASPNWQRTHLGLCTSARYKTFHNTGKYAKITTSAGRITASFRYVGPAMPRAEALRFATTKRSLMDN